MGHLSDNANRLNYNFIGKNLQVGTFSQSDVWFLTLPYFNQDQNTDLNSVNRYINSFIDAANKNATIIILTSPFYASYFLSELNPLATLKVWFGLSATDITQRDGQLNQTHAALLVLTKYKKSLEHTKTRIAYSFCPHCDRTTKDYGGKKHLYHEFGTLMSDVWRDITISYNGNLEPVIDRLQDIFGIEPYTALNHIDLRYDQFNALSTPTFKLPEFGDVINEIPFNESTLLNGDCLEELRQIPDNSIDFCFADPPYNIKKKYESWNDGIDIREYFEWCDIWITELARIIKPKRTVALLNIPQWAARHFKHLITLLDFQDWIIWEALGLPVRMIMPAHYTVLCFSKGEPRPMPGLTRNSNSELESLALNTYKQGYCTRISCIKKRAKEQVQDKELVSNLWWDIHRLKHNSRRIDHPTQLPPMFMYRLISLFTNENEIVLDPFNGAGTTSLCSEQLNRKFIGIELSGYYHLISTNRHNELREGIDPFRKNDNVPKAKNSYVERLKKQKYEVDKKTLQLEVKEISKRLGRIATRQDVIENTQYKIEYFDNYFINWSEVTAAARTTGMAQVENKDDYNMTINGNKLKNT